AKKFEAANDRAVWAVPLETFSEPRLSSILSWKEDGSPHTGRYGAAMSFHATQAPEHLSFKLFAGLPPSLLSNRVLLASNIKWSQIRSSFGFDISAARLRATIGIEAMQWSARAKVLLFSAVRDIWLSRNRASEPLNLANGPYLDVDSKTILARPRAALINAA